MSGLSEQQLAEIRARLEHSREVAGRGNWPVTEYLAVRAALADVPVLLAEVERQAAQIERRRLRLIHMQNDLLDTRGVLSPNGGSRKVPPEIEIHERVTPAVEWLVNRIAELEQQLTTAQAAREVFLAEFENDEPRLFLTLDAAKDALTERRRKESPLLPWDWFPDGDGLWVQWRCDPDTDRPIALMLGSVLPLTIPAGLLAAGKPVACSGCGEDHSGDPDRCRYCTGCGTDHSPSECSYRPPAESAEGGERS